MRHLIIDELGEKLELVCEDDRYSLVLNAHTEFMEVIVLNKREALKIYQALGEEIRGKG